MTGAIPEHPKIFHILHVNNLKSVIVQGCLWSDHQFKARQMVGISIGISGIKQRRLNKDIDSHEGLTVGQCVPFYFCPRSVMLYLLYKANHEDLTYRDGQEPIVHLQADLHKTVAWADRNYRRWAFTLSNAGSSYFEDRCDLADLHQIDWDAVRENQWGASDKDASVKDCKQAEFLMECAFPWHLVEGIGVFSKDIFMKTRKQISCATHKPSVEIIHKWYY